MDSQESQENLKGQEFSAKNVDEAIKLALEKLGLTRDQVEITVLKRGKSGILGLGAEEARILVRPTPPPAEPEIGQLAQEILSQLLQAMDIGAQVELVEPPPQGFTTGANLVALDIRGKDLGMLIGRHGQTLMAVQYLLNVMVSHKTRARIPIMVDVEGYKRRRYEALQSLALRLAQQVKSTKQAVTLEPMPANERRIVHLALSGDSEVVTQSIGAGEARKVVIMAKGRESRPRYQGPPPPPSRAKQGDDNGV